MVDTYAASSCVMADLMVFFGSFAGAGCLGLVGLWRINRSVALENAIEFEEWERT